MAMNLSFPEFDKAFSQLATAITDNAHGAQQHLLAINDIQARLDAARIEAQAKADELRAQGQHDQQTLFED